MKSARTIDELIEALGGTSRVADEFGISDSAVSNWRGEGVIPPGWHLRLFIMAVRLRVRVNLVRVFGLTKDEARILAARHREYAAADDGARSNAAA